MASTYTDNLRLEKQTTGENDNTWGALLNAVLDVIDTAITEQLSLSVAGSSDVTLTDEQALNAYCKFTGTLTGNINVVVPARKKLYIVENATSGAYTLTVKTSAGTGIAVTQGKKALLYGDGTNVVKVFAADDSDLVNDTTPQLGGDLDTNSHRIKWSKGSDLDDDDIDVSNILTVGADGNYFDIGGTQQIDGIATAGVGMVVKLHFDTARTLTHHADNLVLPGGQNIVTAAGDEAEFVEYATADWRCTGYSQAGSLNLQDRTIQRPKLLDYGETVNVIGSIGGGTQDIDLTLGNVVTGTVDTGTTTFTFSNPSASGVCCSFTLILENGGSQTVNWPASVVWTNGAAPTLTASGKDILTFFTVDAGTTWYGFLAGEDMS